MGDIKGIEINDVFGLKKPVTKLIECVSAGVGKFYEPIHVKRMAKAKKQEIEIIGEAITNNINLPTEYQNGNISNAVITLPVIILSKTSSSDE